MYTGLLWRAALVAGLLMVCTTASASLVRAAGPTRAAAVVEHADDEWVTCEDIDCLIEQAQTCSASDLITSITLDWTPVMPMVQTTTAGYHVEPSDTGGCAFHVRYLDNQLHFTEAAVQELLAQGVPQADIDAEEATATREAQRAAAATVDCVFPGSDELVALLGRWKDQTYSTGDLNGRVCQTQLPAGEDDPSADQGAVATTTPARRDPIPAIRQVIERKSRAQAQALASKDLSALRAAATDDYYASLVTNYHGLIDSGVVSLKLVDVDCRKIVATGPRAIARCYETWSTTFARGQSRSVDLNVYTLVEQGGTWKIQADRPRPR